MFAALLIGLGSLAVSRGSRLDQDSALAILYTAAFSGGIILLRRIGVTQEMEEWLFGNIMGLRDSDLWTNFWISFGALGVLTALHRPLLMTLFDAEVAATLGVPVRALNYLLLAVLIVVLISSLQAVGCMLALGLLVTPAATVYLLTDSTNAMFWGGSLLGGLASAVRGAGRLVAQHRTRPGHRAGAGRGVPARLPVRPEIRPARPCQTPLTPTRRHGGQSNIQPETTMTTQRAIPFALALILPAMAGEIPPPQAAPTLSAGPDAWTRFNDWSIGDVLFPALHIHGVGGACSTDPAALASGGHDPNREAFSAQAIEPGVSLRTRYLEGFANHIFFQDAQGDWGNEWEEAFAKLTNLPGGFELKGGQFLSRYGALNDKHLHAWDFVDSETVLSRFLGEDGMMLQGAELSWTLPFNADPTFVSIASIGYGDARDHGGHAHEHGAVESPHEGDESTLAERYSNRPADGALPVRRFQIRDRRAVVGGRHQRLRPRWQRFRPGRGIPLARTRSGTRRPRLAAARRNPVARRGGLQRA